MTFRARRAFLHDNTFFVEEKRMKIVAQPSTFLKWPELNMENASNFSHINALPIILSFTINTGVLNLSKMDLKSGPKWIYFSRQKLKLIPKCLLQDVIGFLALLGNSRASGWIWSMSFVLSQINLAKEVFRISFNWPGKTRNVNSK